MCKNITDGMGFASMLTNDVFFTYRLLDRAKAKTIQSILSKEKSIKVCEQTKCALGEKHTTNFP